MSSVFRKALLFTLQSISGVFAALAALVMAAAIVPLVVLLAMYCGAAMTRDALEDLFI